MPWESFRDGRTPQWHDHPLRKKGKKDPVVELKVVSRKEWGAFPNEDEEPLDLPVAHVRTDDTKSEQCHTKEACIQYLQKTQTEQMREGLPDIKWNFMIGNDGNIYEGRGWKLDATRCYETFSAIKEDCIDIAFIGTYVKDDDIPQALLDKIKTIVDYGVSNNYINCCHRIIPYMFGRITDFQNMPVDTELVLRADWGASPPKALDLELKKPYVHILYTFTGTKDCNSKDECSQVLREFQKTCMEEKGHNDILYNFLVGGVDDGVVYEGRGWDINSPKPKRYFSMHQKSLDIAYIGNYKDYKDYPSIAMVRAAMEFLQMGHEMGKIDLPSVDLIPMRELTE